MDVMKVWLVTAATRAMGAEFARAALEVGHAVVATGWRPAEVTDALGDSNQLLLAALDVTSVDQSERCAGAPRRKTPVTTVQLQSTDSQAVDSRGVFGLSACRR